MEISIQENKQFRQSLTTRAITSPKILIRYHTIMNKKLEFPNRLVTPATNFIATFSKIGYLETKKDICKSKI